MALKNFIAEQGFNVDEAAGFLSGSGAPTGTSGPTSDAAIGFLWFRTDGEGELYRKEADTDSATDWVRMVDESVYTALGIAFDAEDMGTYTGNIITDNGDQAEINQELSDAIEAISGGATGEVNGLTTLADVDASCLVDSCNGASWEIVCWEEGTQNIKMLELRAIHDDVGGADATDTDHTRYAKLSLGSNFNVVFSVALTGTGASQAMKLQASSTTAGVTIKFRRTDIP